MQNEANSSIADCGFWIADSGRPAACRLGPARAGCTNKANRPEAVVQNEPNFRAKPGGTRPQGRGTRGANVQNEPNFPGGAGQLSLAPRPSGLAPAEPIVRNEANSAGGGGTDKYFGEKEL